jgi:hypothetical protein
MKHIKKFNESSENWKNELIKAVQQKKASWQIMDILQDEIDYVEDGVWDISNIEFIEISPSYVVDSPDEWGPRWREPNETEIDQHINRLSEFIDKYPNCVVADAYQTEHPFLLSEKPTVRVKYIGSGFNRGSNNIIDNCPKRILICGEDD